MLTLVCFILVFSSGLSFLINDFPYNATSSPIHEDTIRDLMNLILEEKRFRYQLEDRLNAAESKITKMMQYDAAVSSEMEKEKNELEQLRTQNEQIQTQNEQLRTENQMFKTQLANISSDFYKFSSDARKETENMTITMHNISSAIEDLKLLRTENQMFKTQLANISSNLYKFSSDARKETENMTITMHNISSAIEDLKLKLTETNNGTKQNGTAVGFTAISPVQGTGISSSPLKFLSVSFNSNDVFNMSTGEFVCQQPGLYLFIFTLLRNSGTTEYGYCYIYKNNSKSQYGLAFASDSDTNSYPSGAASYLLYLQHGDRVYLSDCYNSNNFQPETYFTGCLIQAEN